MCPFVFFFSLKLIARDKQLLKKNFYVVKFGDTIIKKKLFLWVLVFIAMVSTNYVNKFNT